MNNTIFYSWQSDLPNSSNRGFIESCIKAAITELDKSEKFNFELNLDRDTKDELGTPDIVNTIFSKIDRSKLFIADVSIINSDSSTKKTPNPNVLVELGYAAKVLGWEKVICFFNMDYGDFNDLPFDLKFRRLLTYQLSGEDKSKVKNRLKDVIKETLQNLYTDGILGDEVDDYLKMQVDTQILSMLNVLGKILYDYDYIHRSIASYKSLLNLELYDIKSIVSKRKFIGFQVFKNFKKIDNELTKILHDVMSSRYFRKETGLSIVNMVKWLNGFDKFNSLRQTPYLFVNTDDRTYEYKAIYSQEINPKNEDGYILLRIIDDSHGKVVDFGQFQEKQKVARLLNYVHINGRYCELYSSLIYEFIQLTGAWLDLTGNEFIIDNLNNFEINPPENAY